MPALSKDNYGRFLVWRHLVHIGISGLVLLSWSMHTVAQSASQDSQPQPSKTTWQYGGFLDFGYLKDFNDPANHLFRSRGTTFHVNEWDVNMGAIYLKKAVSESSRWGTELTLQAGEDTKVFGFSATAPNLPGSRWLRHLGPTNVSYLAP